MTNIFEEMFGVLPHKYLINPDLLKHISNNLILDTFDILSSIYFADISIPFNQSTIEDGRVINISIPVSNLDIWNKNKKILETLANFLSGDAWNIDFTNHTSKISAYQKGLFTFNYYDNVTLLSGGLDSFCGAYENISHGYKSLYIGYKLNNHESHNQVIIHDFLKNNYKIVSILFDKLNYKKKAFTQRTRSLLFFGFAIICASSYNINVIKLYENGMLSLNPEMGSRHTTKTTHPRTIFLLNSLLYNLGINIIIEHPFIFYTKGQIINNLPENFKNQIRYTYTCGASRQKKNIKPKNMHCGVCIPCTLRKISISAFNLEKFDRSYIIDYGEKISNTRKDFIQDYKSSNEYFWLLKQKIDSGEILNYISHIKGRYYSDPDYLIKTQQMLNTFSNEVEMYFSKYPIFS